MTTTAAGLSLLASLALSAGASGASSSDYRRLSGFPWLPSLGFAAASTAALLALRALFFL